MTKPVQNRPARAHPHVVTALIAKRGELAGRIDRLQSDLRQAVVDLDNVEATLRVFAPDMELQGLTPRNVPAAAPAAKGDTTRIVLAALRKAPRPLTTNELTEAVMKERGLAINNASLFRTISRRVGASMRYLKNERGLLRDMPGPGQQHLWQINPARTE